MINAVLVAPPCLVLCQDGVGCTDFAELAGAFLQFPNLRDARLCRRVLHSRKENQNVRMLMVELIGIHDHVGESRVIKNTSTL